MKIERLLIPSQGSTDIPAVMLTPPNPLGAVVLSHGYGGCKEEQLGFGWRMAELGLAVCVIDCRGHGENRHPFDDGVQSDIEAAIDYCRRYGKVAAVGHSLGGRASLISTADFVIGISPGLPKVYYRQTQVALRNLRCYRVEGRSLDAVLEVLATIPEWKPDNSGRALIVVGSRDLPEIIRACRNLEAQGVPVVEIDEVMHTDIFISESTFRTVGEQLKKWFAD